MSMIERETVMQIPEGYIMSYPIKNEPLYVLLIRKDNKWEWFRPNHPFQHLTPDAYTLTDTHKDWIEYSEYVNKQIDRMNEKEIGKF
jgi:hypothetical protein